MTLTRRMTFRIVGLTLGLIILGTASVSGLRDLLANVRTARDEYLELRMIQETGLHAAAARGLLQTDSPDPARVSSELCAAREQLQKFMEFQTTQPYAEAGHQTLERSVAEGADRQFGDVLARLREGAGQVVDTSALAAIVDEAVNDLMKLARVMDHNIATIHAGASHKLYETFLLTVIFSALIISVSVLATVLQYRSLIFPLRRLREGTHRIAAGHFEDRVEVRGEREFQELAQDFNSMAAELQELYRGLEEKVVAKSKELVRSERLASVGFLAAGVAHEINNPLNIISGYAELTLKRSRQTDEFPPAETKQALQIIRDESFRCKGIIEKLLSLARAGDDKRESVSVSVLASDVVGMVAGLQKYRDRRISVRFEENNCYFVFGNSNELKQVLLNLTVNALEAVKPGSGHVSIIGRRRGGWIELAVEDNGIGMSPEVLERVFEPFFTERKSGSERGTGLGLSISHAIIDAHGGRIRAESDGPGRGSRFIVELPAIAPGDGRDDGKAARDEGRVGSAGGRR